MVAEGAVGGIPRVSRLAARLLMVDAARGFVGVTDDDVAAWLRAPRHELLGSSMLDVALGADERRCAVAMAMLLTRGRGGV